MLYRNISIGRGEDTKNIYFYMHKNVLSVITKDIFRQTWRQLLLYHSPLQLLTRGGSSLLHNELPVFTSDFKSPSHNVNRFICSDKLKYRQIKIDIYQSGFFNDA